MKKQRPIKLFSAILFSICFIFSASQTGLANISTFTLSKKDVIGGATLEGTVIVLSSLTLGGTIKPPNTLNQSTFPNDRK